jgi:hypothetical protein
MGEQLSLLGTASADEVVGVTPTREVLLRGAGATSVPSHAATGPIGTASAATVARMLVLAEDAARYNQAPNPRLSIDPSLRRGLGSNGPVGHSSLMADSSGIRDWKTGESVTWPQLLRTLAAQREDEPQVARSRDLAEAYHYLHYYSHVYGGPDDAPGKLLSQLRDAIRELGGDPDAIPA